MTRYLYSALLCMSCSSLRCSGMALVNEGSDSFTYHLPATQHFGMSRTYSPAAERYRALWLMLISRPAEGRKLS